MSPDPPEPTAPSRWTVVANVVDEHPFGEGGETTVRGTKHFRPGTKLYVFGLYPGMCESVVVVGRHRGSNRYVRMVLKAQYLENFRPKVVYAPEVLKLMDYSAAGCLLISDEESAKAWATHLPFWRAPYCGRSPEADGEAGGGEAEPAERQRAGVRQGHGDSMTGDLELTRVAFYAGARSAKLPLVVNDAVEFISGAEAGASGAVISVESLEPLKYLVERGDGGGDAVVAAAELRLIPDR